MRAGRQPDFLPTYVKGLARETRVGGEIFQGIVQPRTQDAAFFGAILSSFGITFLSKALSTSLLSTVLRSVVNVKSWFTQFSFSF